MKLKEEKLLLCSDGIYRKGREIYFPSVQLDAVFEKDGYIKINDSYKSQEFSSFFARILGVNTDPSPTDILRTVLSITSGLPVAEKIEALERIFEFLGRKFSENDKGFIENPLIAFLKTKEWLPAFNLPGKWFKPTEIFPFSQYEIIGMEAPVLLFKNPPKDFQDYLGIQPEPPVLIVAKYLLNKASNSSEEKVSERVYTYLGNHWRQLPQVLQLRLSTEKVIWVDNAYWQGKKVYNGAYCRRWFGHRRAYWKNNIGTGLTTLFENIGVGQGETPSVTDVVNVLTEISLDCPFQDQSLTDEDYDLLITNFDYLGQLNAFEKEKAIKQLSQKAIIPGQDGKLYPQDRIVILDHAQPDLLEKIGLGQFTVPILKERRSEELALTEAGYGFIRQLGVQTQKEVLLRYRSKVETESYNEKLTPRLRSLKNCFERIRLKIKETEGEKALIDALPLSLLDKITVISCAKLIVRFELNNGRGWFLKAPNESEESVLYDSEHNILYSKTLASKFFPNAPIATELGRLFFPISNESTTIAQLLELEPEQAEEYLSQFGYRLMYQTKIEFEVDSEKDSLNKDNTENDSDPKNQDLEKDVARKQTIVEKLVNTKDQTLLTRSPGKKDVDATAGNSQGENDNKSNITSLTPTNQLPGRQNVEDEVSRQDSEPEPTWEPGKKMLVDDTGYVKNETIQGHTINLQGQEQKAQSERSEKKMDSRKADYRDSYSAGESTPPEDKKEANFEDTIQAGQAGLEDKTSKVISLSPLQISNRNKKTGEAAFNWSKIEFTRSLREDNSAKTSNEKKETFEIPFETTPPDEGTEDWQPEVDPTEADIHASEFKHRDRKKASIPKDKTARSFFEGASEDDSNETPGADEDPFSKFTQQSKKEVGRWGEMYAMSYLLNNYRNEYPFAKLELGDDCFMLTHDTQILVWVEWLNFMGEFGQGHDICVLEKGIEHYIEVKTTIDNKRTWFNMTRFEWEFAKKKGDSFICTR